MAIKVAMPGMVIESGLAISTHLHNLITYPRYQLLQKTSRLYLHMCSIIKVTRNRSKDELAL